VSRLNISLDVVNDLKIRERRKSELLGHCPVCGCSDANFNISKLTWRCWHCPACGRITTEDGYVAVEEQEIKLDVDAVRELYTELADEYHKDITDVAVSYLKTRGITEETIRHFKLGFCSDKYYEQYSNDLAKDCGIVNRDYPALFNRITIPYIVDDMCVDLRGRKVGSGITYKQNTPTYISLSGSHESRGAVFPFNYDIIKNNKRIIITEGEFKAVVGHQYGFPVIATPGIFGWQSSWKSILKDKEIILVADFDSVFGFNSPAYMMTNIVSKDIRNLKVGLLYLASNGNKEKIDIDSLLIDGGVKLFEKIINGPILAKDWLEQQVRMGHARKR